MRTITVPLTKIISGIKYPDTGRTCTIKDTTGTLIATATESPAASGQYIFSFTEVNVYGYLYIDGTIQSGYNNNSPFFLGDTDDLHLNTLTATSSIDVKSGGTYKLGGTNINTAGTLTNVAYKNQDNNFSVLQSIDTDGTTDAALRFDISSGDEPFKIGVNYSTGEFNIVASSSNLPTANKIVTINPNSKWVGINTDAMEYPLHIVGQTFITGGLIVSGAISTPNSITGSSLSIDYIDFDTVNTGSYSAGRLQYNDDTKTIQLGTDVNNFSIELGHQEVTRVRNTTGGTLTKGKIVYINGESGNRPTVVTASCNVELGTMNILGVIAANISDSQTGYIVSNGILRGINTTAYAPGTLLYLSTSGDFSATKISAPSHSIQFGQTITQATDGIIYIHIDTGEHLDELHDVKTTTVTDGDLLVYNNSALTWQNTKTLTNITASALKLTSGAGTGKILATDANGNTTWINSSSIGVSSWTSSGADIGRYSNVFVTGNLTVSGSGTGFITASAIKLTNSPTNGYVLTSDANGNATWQAPGAASSNWTSSGANIGRYSDVSITGSLTVSGSGTKIISSSGIVGGNQFNLNGININTAGTLTNVAYKNQDNLFSVSQSIKTDGTKDAVIKFDLNGGDRIQMGLNYSTGEFNITPANTDLPNATKFVTINPSSGWVGINTEAMLFPFDVFAQTRISQSLLIGSSSTDYSTPIPIHVIGTVTGDNGGLINIQSANANEEASIGLRSKGESPNLSWKLSRHNDNAEQGFSIVEGINGTRLFISESTGFVGINTTNPTNRLHVAGDVRITTALTASDFRLTNDAGAGKILATDANGNASWITSASSGGSNWTSSGADITRNSDVRITGSLNVSSAITSSTIRLTTGAGGGKILASDANGNASWITSASSGGSNWTSSGVNIGRYSDVSITGSLFVSGGNINVGTSSLTSPGANASQNYIYIKNSLKQSPLVANSFSTGSDQYGIQIHGGTAAIGTYTGIITIGRNDGIDKKFSIGTINTNNGSFKPMYTFGTSGSVDFSGSLTVGSTLNATDIVASNKIYSSAGIYGSNSSDGYYYGSTISGYDLILRSNDSQDGQVCFGTNVVGSSVFFEDSTKQFLIPSGTVTTPQLAFSSSGGNNIIGFFNSGSNKSATVASGGKEIAKFGTETGHSVDVIGTNVGNTVLGLYTSASNTFPAMRVVQGKIATASATARNDVVLTIPTENNKIYHVESLILMRRTDSIFSGSAYRASATFTNNGVSLAQIDTTTTTVSHEGPVPYSNYNFSYGTSGTNILVNTVGVTGHTITSTATAFVHEVGT